MALKKADFEKFIASTRAGGCPFCGNNNWTIAEEKDGTLVRSRVLDESFVKELNDAFESAADSFEAAKNGEEPQEAKRETPSSPLTDVVVAKCKTCGFIATFDYESVEESNGH